MGEDVLVELVRGFFALVTAGEATVRDVESAYRRVTDVVDQDERAAEAWRRYVLARVPRAPARFRIVGRVTNVKRTKPEDQGPRETRFNPPDAQPRGLWWNFTPGPETF